MRRVESQIRDLKCLTHPIQYLERPMTDRRRLLVLEIMNQWAVILVRVDMKFQHDFVHFITLSYRYFKPILININFHFKRYHNRCSYSSYKISHVPIIAANIDVNCFNKRQHWHNSSRLWLYSLWATAKTEETGNLFFKPTITGDFGGAHAWRSQRDTVSFFWGQFKPKI